MMTENTLPRNQIAAVIPAAGVGRRFGSVEGRGTSKIFYAFENGMSVLEVTLHQFERSNAVSLVVVCANPDLLEETSELVSGLSLGFEVKVVAGGSCRQESVKKGLAVVPERFNWVLIHDAARPFCSPSQIRDVAAAAIESDAAILASPIKHTIKRVVGREKIAETIDRSMLWEAQTPQAFKRELIVKAHEAAAPNSATDDSQLVESLGTQVQIVQGSDKNIKITSKEDISLAAVLFGEFIAEKSSQQKT